MGTFSGTETFESYSNGQDLNGANGGSGWAGAYVASSAGVWSASNSDPGQGSLSGYISRTNPGGGEPYITRQLSSTFNDVTNIMFMIRRGGPNSNVNSYNWGVKPDAGDFSTDGYYIVGFGGNSDIYITARGGSTVNLVTGASQDTWYYIVLQVDPANYRCRGYASTSPITVEPTWSSYSTGNSGTIASTTMGYMTFNVGGANNGTSTWQVDDIKDGTFVSGPTNVKTWDGVTQSTSIKTYFGVDLANTKTVDGVA